MVWGDRHTDFHGHKIIIQVGKNTDQIWPGWDSTLWNGHMEVLSQIELAEIEAPDRYQPEGWYTDMATAEDIQQLRNRRRRARRIPSEREVGTAFKSIALRWLRKQPRMKTAKMEDITKMVRYTTGKDRVGFKIEAKGKTFYLHA